MKFLIILITAMSIAGCSGGGGSASLGSGFTYGSGGSSGSEAPLIHPEPSTLALLGVGLAGLAFAALRKKKS